MSWRCLWSVYRKMSDRQFYIQRVISTEYINLGLVSRDGVVDKLFYGTCYKIENKILEGVYKALACIQVTCRSY